MKKSLDGRWAVSPSEGIAIQRELSHEVIRRWSGGGINLVAGADVHFPSKSRALAAVTILTYPDLELIEYKSLESDCRFPYIPGLLSFREIPALIDVFDSLDRIPDLVLCDGQGIAHPRALGLASHLGIELDIPTVGCAKSPLFGAFREPGTERGARSPIKDKSGKTIGTVLRTRNGTKPIYVSIGHLIDLRTAVRYVLSCTPRFRIPEPLRTAHRLASGNLHDT